MTVDKQLKVAIVGAGPGGLATWIHFRRLTDVQISIYDGARELREVGAGIGLNENTWRHLQLLGVADKIDQFTNRGDPTKIDVENRNGVTGKLISRRYQSSDYAFPEHRLSYTGKVAYRILIPQEDVAHISGIPQGSCFWHTKNTHVYTNPLDNGLFEIATRAPIPDPDGTKVSWGTEVPKEEVVGHYTEYCNTIKQILDVPKKWLEFALFGGPRLHSVVYNGRIALIGDASHPLHGAFGAGAAFAFEDAYVLAQAVGEAQRNGTSVADAIQVYDEVRAPHYEALYHVLDDYADIAKEVEAANQGKDDNEFVESIVQKGLAGNTQWIYKYDVTKVWREKLEAAIKRENGLDPAIAPVVNAIATVA
ncbi:hypothetical protein IAU59_001437 [Kwoniella sp. CBS 9459]